MKSVKSCSQMVFIQTYVYCDINYKWRLQGEIESQPFGHVQFSRNDKNATKRKKAAIRTYNGHVKYTRAHCAT